MEISEIHLCTLCNLHFLTFVYIGENSGKPEHVPPIIEKRSCFHQLLGSHPFSPDILVSTQYCWQSTTLSVPLYPI